MVFQRCSDVAEPRVSKLFSMPKAAGMQLLLQIRNSPGALALTARELMTTTRRGEPALSIDQFGDLSIDHIIASASPRSITKSLATVKSFEL
jgi:hypothetical protein